MSEWLALSDDDDFYISFNVAPVTVTDERFHNRLAKLIKEYGIKPGQLKLELTERVLIKDKEAILDKLNSFIDLGCELMIDDFGTGYSSLSYLHRMPMGTVKIDRSFVLNLFDHRSSIPVVKTIIALANALKMKVLSEGVETIEQSIKLNELGSHQQQGYLFAKAMTATEATDFIKSGKATEIFGVESDKKTKTT